MTGRPRLSSYRQLAAGLNVSPARVTFSGHWPAPSIDPLPVTNHFCPLHRSTNRPTWDKIHPDVNGQIPRVWRTFGPGWNRLRGTFVPSNRVFSLVLRSKTHRRARARNASAHPICPNQLLRILNSTCRDRSKPLRRLTPTPPHATLIPSPFRGNRHSYPNRPTRQPSPPAPSAPTLDGGFIR